MFKNKKETMLLHMNNENLEQQLAMDLIFLATDTLEGVVDYEDLDAAIVAALARALEFASDRKLKPLDQIFDLKQGNSNEL